MSTTPDTGWAGLHALAGPDSEASAEATGGVPTILGGVPRPPGNRLLAAMTLSDRRKLDRVLEPVRVLPGEVLFQQDQHVNEVYFPEAGTVISLRTRLPEGGAVEVDLVGAEGIAGLSAVLGLAAAPFSAVALVGGTLLRMPVGELRARTNASFPLRDLLQRYSAACMVVAAQRVACATAHPLRGRMAAWLCMVGDRAGPGLPVTQEAMAEALGARRPTVNTFLQGMRADGLVSLARGQIALSDADGLASAACACHACMRKTYAKLLPLSRTPTLRSTAFNAYPPWRPAPSSIPRT